MRERIANLLLLSSKMSDEVVSIRGDVRHSNISDTSKESMRKNIQSINLCLSRVDVLLREMIGYSMEDNLNLKYNERRLILLALKRNDGNQKSASKDLKISVRTMGRKLKEHKIASSEYLDNKQERERKALSLNYKNEYEKIIKWINGKNTFYLKDLREHMNIRKYYSPVTHIVDYLRTKNIIQRSDIRNGEIVYKSLRQITYDDLVFVKTNKDRMALN